MIVSKQQLYTAYKKALRWKSTCPDIIAWKKNEKQNLRQLYYELCTDSYHIGKPTRYIIQDPVMREIIALPFRDRIVQHLINTAFYPLAEQQAIHDVYSNMKKRWTLYGVKRVSRFIRSCSDNYRTESYILRLDIQSFFLSIDKQILYDAVVSLISRNVRKYPDCDRTGMMGLIKQSIFKDYRIFTDVSNVSLDMQYPFRKKMKSTDGMCWLPLGNLTSQLFANIYLHQLDLFVKHDLKIRYYGRYVDDFILIHPSKDYLISCLSQIRDFLYQRLHLTLHPHKIYLQSIHKGVRFLGVMIYPYHRVLAKRTIGRAFAKLSSYGYGLLPSSQWQHVDISQWQWYQSRMSYRGLVMHHDCRRVRKQWREMVIAYRSMYCHS